MAVKTKDKVHVEIVEADYSNSKYASDVILLTNAYAEDDMGMEEPLPEEVNKKLIDELKGMPGAMTFLAYANGFPAGIANCFIGFATFNARKLINIHDLYVMPEFRGRNIGNNLLESVQQKARQIGCCRLTLEVRDDNKRARKLYDHFGFGEDDPPVWHLTKEFY